MQAELIWGVKASLIRYVTQLADGRVEARGGAAIDEYGLFHLPFREQSSSIDAHSLAFARTLSFDGEIAIEGHGGLLSIRLSALRVEISRDAVELTAAVIEAGTDVVVRAPIAVLGVGAPRAAGDLDTWPGVEARLTQTGAEVLGQLQYYATQRVDDVSFSAPAPAAHPPPVPTVATA